MVSKCQQNSRLFINILTNVQDASRALQRQSILLQNTTMSNGIITSFSRPALVAAAQSLEFQALTQLSFAELPPNI